jgi:AraC-like DNA-binding protein
VLGYEERPAPAELGGHVECVWAVWDGARVARRTAERILPDGCPELIVHLGDPFARRVAARWVRQPRVFFAGTLTRPWMLRAGARVDTVGIRFRPGGAGVVLGMRLEGTADREVRIDAAVARALLADLRRRRSVEARLDAALAWVRDRGAAAAIPATRLAVTRILRAKGQVRVEELARGLGVSRRRLERQFARELGVTPKCYARIVRLNGVLAALDEGERGPAVELALEAGYFDQPHLLREFRSLAGRSPRARRELDGELARHFTHPDRLRELLRGQ